MELQKLSDKTGISTDALQEWGYAAKKSGLDAKAVTSDLANLQKTMSSPIPARLDKLAVRRDNTCTGRVEVMGNHLKCLGRLD